MPAANAPFATTGEAADWLDAALDHLAAADWASLGTAAHGEMLGRLQGAQAKLTAVNASVLAALTAQSGYELDGHRSAMAWLTNRIGISRGAAAGAIGWQRRLARHGVIAVTMAAGAVSESWGKEIAGWTDPLPQAERDQADEILLEAAAAGVPLADLRVLARSIWETWKAQHPDPGDDGPRDEDGFEDRSLRLGVTFGGAGKLTGDLSAGCAAKLQAIFDSLGKRAGGEDFRTSDQRQHDALDEALSRLIKSDLLPQAAGTDTLAQVLIPFAALRDSALEAEWIAANAGKPGWLTGTVDWQAADDMTEVWISAHGLDRGAEPCGCTCGGCTCRPPAPLDAEAKARLRRTMLAMAADAMSGPTGLAAYLRSRLLGAPFTTTSLPPAGCEVHHLTPWSEGGKTSVDDLKLFCKFHHQVEIHRRGWKVIMHADGSTEAISPYGEILRSNGPPGGTTGT